MKHESALKYLYNTSISNTPKVKLLFVLKQIKLEKILRVLYFPRATSKGQNCIPIELS